MSSATCEIEVGESELLIRAVCTDKYDKDKGTISPSLMMGPDTSVSRSPLIPLHDHWEIFQRCVQKPEKERLLELIGTIGVSRLRKVTEEHDTAEGSKHEVKVCVAPNDCWKPREGHAEIKGKRSRGLANKLIKELLYYKEDKSQWTYDGTKLVAKKEAA